MDVLRRHMKGLVIKLLLRKNMLVIVVNWVSKKAKLVAFKFHTANHYVLRIKESVLLNLCVCILIL
jgi:hypothetical protein